MAGRASGPSGLAADLLFIPALITVRDTPFWAVRKWPNGVFLPLLGAFWLVDLAIAANVLGMANGASSASPRAVALDIPADHAALPRISFDARLPAFRLEI